MPNKPQEQNVMTLPAPLLARARSLRDRLLAVCPDFPKQLHEYERLMRTLELWQDDDTPLSAEDLDAIEADLRMLAKGTPNQRRAAVRLKTETAEDSQASLDRLADALAEVKSNDNGEGAAAIREMSLALVDLRTILTRRATSTYRRPDSRPQPYVGHRGRGRTCPACRSKLGNR
jgi:hypothetical protein